MTVTVVFDSACSKQDIDEALESIRSLEGVNAYEPFVPISFNHHEAGLVRVNLADTADMDTLTARLVALPQVIDVLAR